MGSNINVVSYVLQMIRRYIWSQTLLTLLFFLLKRSEKYKLADKTTLYLTVTVLSKIEMKKQRLKNKLEKLKYYCYRREQYNPILYKWTDTHIYRYIREGGREKLNGVWYNRLVMSHTSHNRSLHVRDPSVLQ